MDEKILAMNEAFVGALLTPGLEKRATDLAEEYIRTKIREEGFYRKIIPFEDLPNERLVRRLDTDKPYYIVDKETDCPAAVTVGFKTLPPVFYVKGLRFPIGFERIETEKAVKDVDELRSWHMDLRQVMSDNMLREMHTEEDAGFIEAMDTILVGLDQIVPFSGISQWQTIPGGITRESFQDALKIMPRASSRLEVQKVLVNNITIREILKWGRDEVGGDKSQDLLVNGWVDEEFAKVRFIVTIKHELVIEDQMRMFAAPKFLGKAYELTPPTMIVKREGPILEWWSYETIGGAFGHTGGLSASQHVP